MDDPFLSMLRAVYESKEMEKKSFASKTDAKDALDKFLKLDRPDIKEGDQVERNEFGMSKYKLPGNNQVAVCVRKITPSGRHTEDMLMCVALAEGLFETYPVDSRYYRVAGSNVTNVFKFRKKDE